MEDSIPYTWDFDSLIKNSKTNNTGRSHSKDLLLQIMYTNMPIITMFLQEMFPCCPEKATFSYDIMEQQFTLLLCMFKLAATWIPTNIFSYNLNFIMKFKSRLQNTWISCKLVAGCTGSLQTKQQAITCLQGYELMANLFETGLLPTLS